MDVRTEIVTGTLYGLLAVCLSGCATFDGLSSSEHTPVVLTPVQHLGSNYSVTEVHVNGEIAGGAGRGGGGGAMNCCVLLPGTWRPGLVAKVTWKVLDWSNEDRLETKDGIYRSIRTIGRYVAEVPVEHYDAPETLYIHFYQDGKARVVASIFSPFDGRHPISLSPSEASLAVAGTLLADTDNQSGAAAPDTK